MPSRYILPPRGETEEILKIDKPDIGMLILSTDEYKLYTYVNNNIEWKCLSQNILAFEYFSWGFTIRLLNGIRSMFLKSKILNPNNYISLRFNSGDHESHSKYVGVKYEITCDTDLRQLYVHDGVTPGGLLL